MDISMLLQTLANENTKPGKKLFDLDSAEIAEYERIRIKGRSLSVKSDD